MSEKDKKLVKLRYNLCEHILDTKNEDLMRIMIDFTEQVVYHDEEFMDEKTIKLFDEFLMAMCDTSDDLDFYTEWILEEINDVL